MTPHDTKKKIRIIGIDPGSHTTGYGVIEKENNTFHCLTHGAIRTSPKSPKEKRYETIFNEVELLLKEYKPEALAIETQFVYKNVKSVLTLGMARGVILLASARSNTPLFEYAPREAKIAVTGSGGANKKQVQNMVQILLSLSSPPSEDAADALSLAICHTHHLNRMKIDV